MSGRVSGWASGRALVSAPAGRPRVPVRSRSKDRWLTAFRSRRRMRHRPDFDHRTGNKSSGPPCVRGHSKAWHRQSRQALVRFRRPTGEVLGGVSGDTPGDVPEGGFRCGLSHRWRSGRRNDHHPDTAVLEDHVSASMSSAGLRRATRVGRPPTLTAPCDSQPHPAHGRTGIAWVAVLRHDPRR